MKQDSAKSRVVAVVVIAGFIPALVTLVARLILGSAPHIQEPIHECLELTGCSIALAVAMLVWLRARHEGWPDRLVCVAIALIGMGLIDGVHAVMPVGVAWSWLRHGSTLAGGLLFALVWMPLPAYLRGRRWLAFVILAPVLAGAAVIFWNAGFLPFPFEPSGYSSAATAANVVGGVAFVAAALFFVRRYLREPATEDLIFASQTLLFAVSALLFGFSQVWAADWWMWHGFRLLAYAVVLIAAYGLVVGLYSDLAEQTRKSERQTAELRRLAAIVESSDDAIMTKSLDGTITTWNEGAVRLYGYTAAEAIGQPVNLLAPVELQAEFSDVLGRVRRGESVRHETVRVCKDQRRAYVSVAVSPLKDIHGNIIGASAVTRDVTDRKQAEEALRKSKTRLDLAQKAGRIAAWEWVIESGEVIWTPEFDVLYGRPAGSPAPDYESWRQLVHPHDIERVERDLQRAIDSKTDYVSEFRIIWPDSTTHWMAARGTPFYSDLGKPSRMIGVNMDITDRKRAEQEIRELNAGLERSVAERTADLVALNKELESFNYSVSHDLRAPLRHIDGFSKIVLETYGDSMPDEARRYLQRVREGARRMGRMIDELLELSRTSRREVSKQLTGLRTLVMDVVEELKTELQDRDIEWHIADLPFAYCDPALTREVFANLLSNAVKFSRTRATAVIEVGHISSAGETVLYVRDNGVGFSMKYAGKLFGVFQRLHRREDFEGTGVGLVTVQRIIRKHGGRIWTEAELEKGATFYFTLGVADPPGRHQPEPEMEPTPVLVGEGYVQRPS